MEAFQTVRLTPFPFSDGFLVSEFAAAFSIFSAGFAETSGFAGVASTGAAGTASASAIAGAGSVAEETSSWTDSVICFFFDHRSG